MSNGSSTIPNDQLSRKRQLLELKPESLETPSKKPKSSSRWGNLLFTPFSSFIGMFRSEKEDFERGKKEEKDDEDEDVFVENKITKVFEVEDEDEEEEEAEIIEMPIPTRSLEKTPKNKKEVIVFLNEENVENSSEQTDEVGENESTCEVQEDPEVEVVGVVRRKSDSNNALNIAKRVQNEIVFLNEHNEQNEDSDDVSVISETITPPSTMMSPTPNDSASRSETPTLWRTNDNQSATKMRDYWRLSSARKITPKRTPLRFNEEKLKIERRSPYSQMSKRKEIKNKSVSFDKYVQELVKAGVIPELNKKNKTTKMSSNANEMIKKARQKIAELQSSKSSTPNILSRQSSICSSEDRTIAGGSKTAEQRATDQKLLEMKNRMENLSFDKNFDRYSKTYELTTQREYTLTEELRIRGLVRVQTKEELDEEIRQKLSLKGIVIKPKKRRTEIVELPAESDKLCQKVWNSDLNESEVFVEDFSVKITRKDLCTLRKVNWLNDEIINFYLQLICKRSENDLKYPKVHAFSTFFYANLSTKGYGSVKRWTRKIDVFSYDVILVPVHLRIHWCMAVIDLKEKKIDYYDSLGGKNEKCLELLKNYLSEESKDKKKEVFNFSGWTFNLLEDIPYQKNGSDCGVFSCQFGEFASRRLKPSFTQDHMPYYRKRMLFEICTKKLLSAMN